MITAQDIREKEFEKALFGGYDMSPVDSFKETVANDLALLQKENATLKAKMKVLVDKIEDYRSSEDAIRMAVVSAQRLGNSIEQDAREKADRIIAEAKAEAEKLKQDAEMEVELEQARLTKAKESSLRFLENMQLLCSRQRAFLDQVGQLDFVQELRAARAAESAREAASEKPESTEIHETVKSIEETVAKVADEPVDAVRPDFSAAAAIDELPTRSYSFVSDPDDSLEKTAQFSFEDFGK